MDPDQDTFLVALYTTVDDLYRQHCAPAKPRRRGAKPYLSDSEVLTPASYQGHNARAVRREHAGWRHVVETTNEHLEHTFHLLFPGACSSWRLLARIAAKLAAFDLSVWLNRFFGRPDLAFATLFEG